MTESKSTYTGRIHLYSDGADRAAMLEMGKNPLIKGLTTNPSLMKKAGVKDYIAYAKDILAHINDKPISFEVFADSLGEMRRQALEINSWGKNVYVKIPITNSLGESTLGLVKELSHTGVKLNVTAIMTLSQVRETCSALKGGAPSIVSVFAGRVADTGRDPMPLMKESLTLCQSAGPDVKLLWASTRELYNIVQAEEAGTHIITVPFDIIKKLSGLNKNLVELSLDTVKTFKADAEQSGFKI